MLLRSSFVHFIGLVHCEENRQLSPKLPSPHQVMVTCFELHYLIKICLKKTIILKLITPTVRSESKILRYCKNRTKGPGQLKMWVVKRLL